MGLLIFPHESELEYIISLFNAIKTKVINLEQIFSEYSKKKKIRQFPEHINSKFYPGQAKTNRPMYTNSTSTAVQHLVQ